MNEKKKMPEGKRDAIIYWVGVLVLMAAGTVVYLFKG